MIQEKSIEKEIKKRRVFLNKVTGFAEMIAEKTGRHITHDFWAHGYEDVWQRENIENFVFFFSETENGKWVMIYHQDKLVLDVHYDRKRIRLSDDIKDLFYSRKKDIHYYDVTVFERAGSWRTQLENLISRKREVIALGKAIASKERQEEEVKALSL